MEISKPPGVILRNPEPGHDFLKDNKDDPDIEPLFDDIKDKDEEYNLDTWNFFDE